MIKERGWSNRKIAVELGIHRETVARYIKLCRPEAKPATNAPTGSEDIEQVALPPRLEVASNLAVRFGVRHRPLQRDKLQTEITINVNHTFFM